MNNPLNKNPGPSPAPGQFPLLGSQQIAGSGSATGNPRNKDMSVLKFLQNCGETENSEYTEEIVKNLDNDKASKIEIIPSAETIPPAANDNDDLVEDEETDVVCDLTDVTSKFHQNRAETRSITSSTSTIHPDIVKARVKQSLEKRGKKGQARRQIAKGEASAKTRTRRDTKQIISTSSDAFWG